MKKGQKILSLMLAVMIILSTVPMAFAEGDSYKVGDIIQFGSYPQSEVTDEALVAKLNDLAPEWDEWTSYGYYTGDNNYGSMVQGDWMRYTDLNYNNEKYRGVKFTQYRQSYTYSSFSHSTYQDDNGYYTNTVYWFKFETIDWQILDPNIGFVMSMTILDSQPYSNTIYQNGSYGDFHNDKFCFNYANDYETSSIRRWLNDDFYNTAFSDSEKNKICTTSLNNNAWGNETFDSNTTNDKIFLVSYNEIKDAYEFDPYSISLKAKSSEYAKSQGIFCYLDSNNQYNDGNSFWILRSPGCNSMYCSAVAYNGYIGDDYGVDSTVYGIRPAFRFYQMSNIGQSESEKPVPSSPDEPTIEPDTPDEPSTPDTPTNPTDDCSCNCHKGGITGLIFKIINFFQKLFGMNKVCACGVTH